MIFNTIVAGSGGIKLDSIAVTTPPTKTSYLSGEHFDPTGMVVTATYSNGAKLATTGYTVEPSGPLPGGITSVTIRYTEGGVTKTVTLTVTVERKNISAVPSQSGTLTYSGSAQSPSWSNYDSSKMTLGGVTSGTNAGSYNATFTPKDDYCWSDGSTSAKTVTWSIEKAAGSLSLSKTSITLNADAKSTTFTVTRAGDGAISAVSSDTSVATVSVSGTTVTVNSVNDKTGTATITVSVAAGTNHTVPSNKTCAVSCEFIPALNDCTWAQIKKISDAGLASSYFAVGDRKAVALNGTVGSLSLSGTYYCYIIGINHNSAKEGANRIHFQFGKTAASGGTDICFVDSGYNSNKTSGSWFNMNNSQSNSGGWNSSRMRTVICPAYKSAMPSDLQAVLKTVTKYSDNTGGGSNTASCVTATTDDIFLLAEWEVFGARRYANSSEQNYQAQYAYYSAGNSKVRYRHSSTGSTANWWLRSVRADNSTSFCYVSTSGSASCGGAYNSRGFAPAFCV